MVSTLKTRKAMFFLTNGVSIENKGAREWTATASHFYANTPVSIKGIDQCSQWAMLCAIILEIEKGFDNIFLRFVFSLTPHQWADYLIKNLTKLWL